MELGMGRFGARRWQGLNHHLMMALIAYTFLMWEHPRAKREEVE